MKKSRKTNIYAIFSHIYEHYENTLFTFAGPFLLGLFFGHNAQSSRMAVYLSMAASFWTRPLGALIFSSIGDIRGRKKALTYVIVLCGMPSLVISFLPTYAVIGIWAPLCLIAVRVIQGIGAGGGFYATLTLISETDTNTKWKKNLLLGISFAMGFFGSVLGILCASYFLDPKLPEGSWRVPFMIGGFYGLFLFLARKVIKESRLWKESPKSHSMVPFTEVFRYNPKNVFAVFLVGMGMLAPFYVATTWMPRHITDLFQHHPANVLLSTSLIFTVCGIFIIFFTVINTWISKKVFGILTATIGCGISFLLFWSLKLGNYTLLQQSQIWLALYTSFISGTCIILIQKLFPVQYKFSGFAIPFSLGQAIFLGSTPLMCEFLFKITSEAASVAYIVITSVIFVVAAIFLSKPLEE